MLTAVSSSHPFVLAQEHLFSSSLWQSVSKLAKKGRLQGADDTRWELLNRASQGGGFVAVSWRSTVERLFSQVGIAFSKYRKSSSADTLSDILFAKLNLD